MTSFEPQDPNPPANSQSQDGLPPQPMSFEPGDYEPQQYGTQPTEAYGQATPGYSEPRQPYAAPAPTVTQDQSSYSMPAPPPAQYSPSYSGATYPSSRGTDGVSIAALVVGFLGGGILAIILGAVGIRRTADGTRSGGGMAWTGLVLGILGTIAATALVVWPIATASVFFDPDNWEFEDGSTTVWSDADTYGDDPELDALWDACASGDMVACDDLAWESPIGSDYEEFGETCGGVGLPADQFWCEP